MVEAHRLPRSGEDASKELVDFLHDCPVDWESSDKHGSIIIHTLEGDMHAEAGDYIIKGVQGEYYPCKPDIFEQTYEPAE